MVFRGQAGGSRSGLERSASSAVRSVPPAPARWAVAWPAAQPRPHRWSASGQRSTTAAPDLFYRHTYGTTDCRSVAVKSSLADSVVFRPRTAAETLARSNSCPTVSGLLDARVPSFATSYRVETRPKQSVDQPRANDVTSSTDVELDRGFLYPQIARSIEQFGQQLAAAGADCTCLPDTTAASAGCTCPPDTTTAGSVPALPSVRTAKLTVFSYAFPGCRGRLSGDKSGPLVTPWVGTGHGKSRPQTCGFGAPARGLAARRSLGEVPARSKQTYRNCDRQATDSDIAAQRGSFSAHTIR